jgi:hypothetical protein
MIHLLQRSTSIRIPNDPKTARAALRLLGAFEAGTAFRLPTKQEKAADAMRTELIAREGMHDQDRETGKVDTANVARIEALKKTLAEGGPK